MTDWIKLIEIQRTNMEFERQLHLTNWFIQSSPHMPSHLLTPTVDGTACNRATQQQSFSNKKKSSTFLGSQVQTCRMEKHSVLFSESNTSSAHPPFEIRKPKLRRFNSHDASSNMFSVADFENARLARRNEIEMRNRLQRHVRLDLNSGESRRINNNSNANEYFIIDYRNSNCNNSFKKDTLAVEEFLIRHALPTIVRVSYAPKFNDETMQSYSSNGSSTKNSNSSSDQEFLYNTVEKNYKSSGKKIGSGPGTENERSITIRTSSSSSSSAAQGPSSSRLKNALIGCDTGKPCVTVTSHANDHTNISKERPGSLFLLYRWIRSRNIFHGYNAKTSFTNRKKSILIPQEFPGYFSLVNDKGVPTAMVYTSLIQLVRERVYKFVSVDNMPAFTESQSNGNNAPVDGCLAVYNSASATNNRPHYMKTTAHGGQVFRLLAVFEDGKQESNSINSGICGTYSKSNSNHGREKEKARYAQLLNDNRQVLYVSLSTKGKFYEIEPGVPQILQKLEGLNTDHNKKVNPECVHRITTLITPNKDLPITLRYISGPSNLNSNIPESICITHVTTENVIIACPIDNLEMQTQMQLIKLHVTSEMNIVKTTLGFETEQRMLSNPNVQNMLRYCQFNCEQFLKTVEIDIINRPERSSSKTRTDGLKILKPLHFPKLLRREKSTIYAHEKEESIIFFTKSDLENMQTRELTAQTELLCDSSASNCITEKMKVFQSTKKRWFRKHNKNKMTDSTDMTRAQIDVVEFDNPNKRMSMERYSDMSKLLQERFSESSAVLTFNKNNDQGNLSVTEHGDISDTSCSDTEITTLERNEAKFLSLSATEKNIETLLKKSISLQDIEVILGSKPDLLETHNITEVSKYCSNIENAENFEPTQQSFITEKLYNEFHVKTRQYSKSSSSLHQLLNFSLPQKLQIHDNKRSLAEIKQTSKTDSRPCDFSIGAPVTGRRATGGLCLLNLTDGVKQCTSLNSTQKSAFYIEDDLPYSSVRDSLIISSDESPPELANGNICQALNLIDSTKENIYAEICYEPESLNRFQLHNLFPGDAQSIDTYSSELSNDGGDYATLSSTLLKNKSQDKISGPDDNELFQEVSGAISRVRIARSSSPATYQKIYLCKENYTQKAEQHKDLHRQSHITTVELQGENFGCRKMAKEQGLVTENVMNYNTDNMGTMNSND